MDKRIRVDVWSDVACPWCWVGKRRLEAAIDRFDGDVDVFWHAFELNPQAPRQAPKSVDYADRLARKYGMGAAQAQQFIDRMVGAGAEEGIEFRFDRIRPGNTFDAHRLLAFAATRGAANEVKERLFEAYMSNGQAVTDRAVLIEIAVAAGLDEDEVAGAISTDAGATEVRDDERAAARMGVSGVPFFVVGGRYAVAGAQPADVLLEALDKAADEPIPTGADAAVGPACGPDGCD